MKVSLLIPVYGVEDHIGKCVHSLFGQTYSDIEYVFVDDCTPDDSLAVLAQALSEYPHRTEGVRIVRHDMNRGLAAARNTALEHATGEYILHVDGDDYLEPDAVRSLMECAREHSADIVHYDMNEVFADHTVNRRDRISTEKKEYIRQLLHREITLGVSGKFIRAGIFRDHGVRFVEGLDYGEDFVTSPRLAYYADTIVKLDRNLYNYVQYNPGAYTKNINSRSLDNIIRALDILVEFFSTRPDAGLYAAMLDTMKLRTKVGMLKIAGTDLRKKIIALYPEINESAARIPAQDRILLILARAGRWKLLDAYVKYGFRIKTMLGLKG